MKAPDKVKVLILIEPSGGPDLSKEDISVLKNVPHLFVFGDFIEKTKMWISIEQNQKRYMDALNAKGTDTTWISLPAMGIKGNTHMIMMDKNSDQVAAIVQDWMKKKNLMK